jgi:hypothetical protein
MIPKFGLAAEPAQFDHRKREVETVFLGPKHNLLIEIEARLILRRILRQQPSIVTDRDENTDVHDGLLD